MPLDIWTEKYRPQKLGEVINQTHIVDRLKVWVNEGSIPNMLFAGPAGVGKTTIALALAKALFGENWSKNFLELNASDERGIDIVRGRIKDFARIKPIGYDFKIIFLDESDALTREAQQALRRTMEKYSSVCRFILSCVAPDTKIVLPEEVEIKMEDFMKEFENKNLTSVTTLNEEVNQITNNQVLCSIKMNPRITGKKVFELTTMTGRKLKITGDHPILTDSGWKRTAELNIDDKIVVYPNLETTYFENNGKRVFQIDDFLKFLSKKEKNAGYKSIFASSRFEELDSMSKRKIINRIKELNKIIETSSGLTEREYDIYKIIKKFKNFVERSRIQKRIGLSRIRLVQLLKELEKKGYIKRSFDQFDKKIHYFKTSEKEPIQLRNKADIKRAIEKEFGVNISWAEIKKLLSKRKMYKKGYFDRTFELLRNNNLLNLKYNSREVGAFTRIFAFIYGDGHITKNKRTIVFTGNVETLNEVKKDLQILGLKGTQITNKKIKHVHRGREFVGVTTSFRLNSDLFIRFLEFLGAPIGDKIIDPYKIPGWIMNGTRFVKREFLRSLYGCEGYSPRINRMNFEALTLRMHKSRKLRRNMLYFFNQIKSILNEFDVKSCIKIRKLNYQRNDGHITDSYELFLNTTNENMFKFFSRVGYAYEEEKNIKARLGAEYLKHKLYYLNQYKAKAKNILISAGTESYRALARKHDCSLDFVINRFRGKYVHLPRNFPTFNTWSKEFNFGNGLVFNKLIEMKEIESDDVRDITCFKNHNFIANGIVSHNCNYSSRLIEPIQSRCVVFRFRALTEENIKEYVDRIVSAEKLKAEPDISKVVYEVGGGDLRRVANLLQACATFGKITKDSVYKVSAQAKPTDIKDMVDLVLKGNFAEARKKLYEMLINKGIAAEDIIKGIHRQLFELQIDEKKKIRLLEKIGEYEFRLNQGGTPEIQIQALLAQFINK